MRIGLEQLLYLSGMMVIMMITKSNKVSTAGKVNYYYFQKSNILWICQLLHLAWFVKYKIVTK